MTIEQFDILISHLKGIADRLDKLLDRPAALISTDARSTMRLDSEDIYAMTKRSPR